MYQSDNVIRNKWENKCIDAKSKNAHRRSRNKLPRRSSNSLKQEIRNGKFNLQLFNRLYTNKTNEYSLDKYLKSDNIHDDHCMILNDQYYCNDVIDIWQCSKCTYINIEKSSYCKICELSYYQNNNSIISSDSETSITTYSSLSSYISIPKISNNRKKIKIKRKKAPKKSSDDSFKFDDISFKKFKKYMKKNKTSIIAYKKIANDNKWNAAKIKKRKNNANKLFECYRTVYLSKNKDQNEIIPIIKSMTSFIPKKSLKIAVPETNANTLCKVCYSDTKDDEKLELVSMTKYCSHCMICSHCFIEYLQITICDDENIIPWIQCPAPDCKAPINPALLFKYVSIDNLYQFACSFIYKHLQRSSYWIDCPDTNNKQCKFGFIVTDKEDLKKECMKLKCEGCGCDHTVKENRSNDGFNDLISSGVLRECPECSYPAMKDYGMCNIMHCAKCGIYWNWRTKETGTSSNEVKQRSRSNGTLWEPGELSYQQNLERNNLSEFIALLARNGIRYDPNYRRGS